MAAKVAHLMQAVRHEAVAVANAHAMHGALPLANGLRNAIIPGAAAHVALRQLDVAQNWSEGETPFPWSSGGASTQELPDLAV
eukprot:CAMPEP_0178396302 /NCGR_PEP_ID=MMETSP0689_2-20121128/13660_1 /TAXON_ID=160604 /ORGANISM="Amphidinium massartii, Strain CS-259" /LENGTH=82 /DNA_ID=CAMNT_0020016975 /DNA_START=336 /DNA_END=585 /DNA_ORIENTATION=-